MSLARGWCPTARRPMAAADGLIVRVRPCLARLTLAQAIALSGAARRWGNGLLDLTSRAAIQVRGVGERDHDDILAALVNAGLVDADPAHEAHPPVLVDPSSRAGDDTHRIAGALAARLDELPPLPAKVGIAIDAGCARVLADDPADFRIERGETGALILRADGRPTGVALDEGGEIEALIALAHWFAASGGVVSGRMARHSAALPSTLAGTIAPCRRAKRLASGPHPSGLAVGVPFGRLTAERLADLMRTASVTAVRLTPWRLLLLEGDGIALPGPGSLDADTALLAADACVGAPECARATVETRPLAARLAPLIAGSLHVSGCAKGCARSRPADIVLTGRDGAFDLAFDAQADARPVERGLSPARLIERFGRR